MHRWRTAGVMKNREGQEEEDVKAITPCDFFALPPEVGSPDGFPTIEQLITKGQRFSKAGAARSTIRKAARASAA